MSDSILLKDFIYPLPDERIALYPLAERDSARLLVFRNKKITHSHFSNLAEHLPQNSILFFNNTRVIPARLLFKKETGSIIELFLLNPVSPSSSVQLAMEAKGSAQWSCLIGNRKRWKSGTRLYMETAGCKLTATLVNDHENIVEFRWEPEAASFAEIVTQIGSIPLPPYIERQTEEIDKERYQTVYAQYEGAVAAPTAGLHFTNRVFDKLEEKGIKKDFLTLHVGAGTFLPIKVENAVEHNMHAEQVLVTRENIENLLQTDKKIISVGTTSARTLESLYWFGVKLMHDKTSKFIITQEEPYTQKYELPDREAALQAIAKKMDTENLRSLQGSTAIFIRPGYEYKIIDGLITNFHQPASTLILLVAALTGNYWKEIYHQALENDYRFLSYGDSSLLFND